MERTKFIFLKFYLVTSDDFDLTRGHQRFKRAHKVFQHDPCPFISFVSNLILLLTVLITVAYM